MDNQLFKKPSIEQKQGVREILTLFFSLSDVKPSKTDYARQGAIAKKLLSEYGYKELYETLDYIISNKDKYKMTSLALIPYIIDEVRLLIKKQLIEVEYQKEMEKSDDVNIKMANDELIQTSNNTKKNKFGRSESSWENIFR